MHLQVSQNWFRRRSSWGLKPWSNFWVVMCFFDFWSKARNEFSGARVDYPLCPCVISKRNSLSCIWVLDVWWQCWTSGPERRLVQIHISFRWCPSRRLPPVPIWLVVDVSTLRLLFTGVRKWTSLIEALLYSVRSRVGVQFCLRLTTSVMSNWRESVRARCRLCVKWTLSSPLCHNVSRTEGLKMDKQDHF